MERRRSVNKQTLTKSKWRSLTDLFSASFDQDEVKHWASFDQDEVKRWASVDYEIVNRIAQYCWIFWHILQSCDLSTSLWLIKYFNNKPDNKGKYPLLMKICMLDGYYYVVVGFIIQLRSGLYLYQSTDRPQRGSYKGLNSIKILNIPFYLLAGGERLWWAAKAHQAGKWIH